MICSTQRPGVRAPEQGKTMSRIAPLTALALAAGLLPGLAAGASDGTFIVTNASDYSVVGFQTGAKGVWSKDWIPGDVMLPGEQFRMSFSTGGDCVVPTLVTFEDGSFFDVDVDYCSTDHLVLYNDTIEAP